MTNSSSMADVYISEAAWRLYSAEWFINARVWSPVLIFPVFVMASLLGLPVPFFFENVAVWIEVGVFFIAVYGCVELLPWLAARLWPRPTRQILRVDEDTLHVRLERQLDIPLCELARVSFQSPRLVLLFPRLYLHFERQDGSEFLVQTGVADSRLFEALDSLNQWLRGGEASADTTDEGR